MTDLRERLEEVTVGKSPPPLPASGTYTAEQVAAFESEHGHDIRLDCYPEYGCLVQSAAANAIFEAAPYLLDVVEAARLVALTDGKGEAGHDALASLRYRLAALDTHLSAALE